MSNFIENTPSSDVKTEQITISTIHFHQNAINILEAYLAGDWVDYVDPITIEQIENIEYQYTPNSYDHLGKYLADEQIEVIENNQEKNLNAVLNPQESIFFKTLQDGFKIWLFVV